jgi:acetyl-CoA C-acetyltransferase
MRPKTLPSQKNYSPQELRMSQTNVPGNTPIIVGVSQRTYRDPDNIQRTPISAMLEVCELAFTDSGRAEVLRRSVDAIVTGRPAQEGLYSEFPEITPRFPGLALKAAWNVGDAKVYKGFNGGCSIQLMINNFAERLANGEHKVVVITAMELQRTLQTAVKRGCDLKRDLAHWGECPQGDCDEPWKEKDIWGSSAAEAVYGLEQPVHFYPLFENAQRHAAGRSIEEHQTFISELFNRISKIASNNPYAAVQKERSAREIKEAPYIVFPHTTKMVSLLNVDMGGAIILTTVDRARQLGIAEEKWIYLNGCADIEDKWYVSERVDYVSSNAARIGGNAALDMAGIKVDDLDLIDIYSCFPCAVMAVVDALEIDYKNKDLTIAGGLSYFGGPGSSYPLHAICSMVEKLREKPGANAMVTGNSWYLTKESFGIYSTKFKGSAWHPPSSADLQKQIEAYEYPTVLAEADGKATVETYTVLFGPSGPERGIIVGKLETGERFLANTFSDRQVLDDMISREAIGRRGTVSSKAGKSVFVFND